MNDSDGASRAGQKVRYIRNQAWCECERSCNVSTGTLEIGLSVYECRLVSKGVWEPTGEAFTVRAQKFQGQERRHLDGLEQWYLVSGHVIGTGADGEPLITQVNAHAFLQWDGARYFMEVSPCDFVEPCNHPNHPDCTCSTVDDLLREADDATDDDDIEMADAYETLNARAPTNACVSQPSVRAWRIETRDGAMVTMVLPSFRQVISNPDGSQGTPGPLDGNVIILNTTTGQVTLSDSDIESGEWLNGDFRFRTVNGEYVGQPILTSISKLVVSGIVKDRSMTISVDQILRFQSQ